MKQGGNADPTLKPELFSISLGWHIYVMLDNVRHTYSFISSKKKQATYARKRLPCLIKSTYILICPLTLFIIIYY